MTSLEKYSYWAMLSEYDIESAKILLDKKRYNHVAYLCQQATERLLKGMFVYHTGKECPKSHNIPFLANKLATHPRFCVSDVADKFIREKEQYDDFFLDLMFYYTSDYPFSYKTVMDRFVKQQVATDVYNSTVNTLNWLKSFQPLAIDYLKDIKL